MDAMRIFNLLGIHKAAGSGILLQPRKSVSTIS